MDQGQVPPIDTLMGFEVVLNSIRLLFRLHLRLRHGCVIGRADQGLGGNSCRSSTWVGSSAVEQRTFNPKTPSRRFPIMRFYWGFRLGHLARISTKSTFNCFAVFRQSVARGPSRGKGSCPATGHPGGVNLGTGGSPAEGRGGGRRGTGGDAPGMGHGFGPKAEPRHGSPGGGRRGGGRSLFGWLGRQLRLELTGHALPLGALLGSEKLFDLNHSIPRFIVPLGCGEQEPLVGLGVVLGDA